MAKITRVQDVWKVFEYPHKDAPHEHGIFVLGCLDTYRNTVLSQQYRALTLVNALKASGRLNPRVGKRRTVGIVGGGVAGITAAMQCVKAGANVRFFHNSEKVLSIFEKAEHRWLHPGLFNWPLDGWDVSKTSLPHLNWEFNSAQQVAKSMQNEFESFCNRYPLKENGNKGGIKKEFPNEWELADGNPSPQPRIVLKEKSESPEPFDHLIIAVGFGIEKIHDGGFGYWDGKKDDISERGNPKKPKHYVIVGCGDGGLFDCFRACTTMQNERELLRDFLNNWNRKEHEMTREHLKPIAARRGATQQEYNNIVKNHAPKALELLKEEQALTPARKWIRNDTQVTLIGKNRPIGPDGAAPLNRFLLALLEKSGCNISIKKGDYKSDAGDDSWTIEGTQFSSKQPALGKLVLRLGPQSALESFSSEIYNDFKQRAADIAGFDFHCQYYEFDSSEHVKSS